MAWACVECGSHELTDCVGEADLEYMACTSCGCNEFVKIELTGEDDGLSE